MGDNGIYRDIQMVGNLLVRHALHQADDDFTLAVGYRFHIVAVANHVGESSRDIVVLYLALQHADGRDKDFVLHIAMVA